MGATRLTIVRIFAACFLFVGASTQGLAEEAICRYCSEYWNSQMPPGMQLEGRFQYAPVRQVDVTHIKLDVTPNFEDKTVSGTTWISGASDIQAGGYVAIGCGQFADP